MTALSERKFTSYGIIRYQIRLVKLAVMEGTMNLPQMGLGYLNAVPRQIAQLRNEAIKCYNSIKVQKMPLSYSGFLSKTVYKITQDSEQLKRAVEGIEGPTEIRIEPEGELIEIRINEYLVILVEPVTLPHRTVKNHLII